MNNNNDKIDVYFPKRKMYTASPIKTKKTLKSRKGKAKFSSKNMLFILGGVSIISLSVVNNRNNNLISKSVQIKKNFGEENIEELAPAIINKSYEDILSEEKDNNKDTIYIQTESELKTDVLLSEEPEEPLVENVEETPVMEEESTNINEDYRTCTIDKNRDFEGKYDKRREIHELYGDLIYEYCTMYGLDPDLYECLLTHEGGKGNNVGSITTALIGEKINVPTFDGDTYLGDELIYISKYDDDNAARKAKKEGYNVYSISEVKNNLETNIHISTALLAHLINYRENGSVIKGIASYNVGYPYIDKLIKKGYNEDDLINANLLASVDDGNYIGNIIRYAYKEEIENGFNVKIVNQDKSVYIVNQKFNTIMQHEEKDEEIKYSL